MNIIESIKKLFSSQPSVASTQNFPGIIVAKVTKLGKHPNADRLQVVELSDGTKTIAPVVCGAWNFKEGDLVALALPGATIPQNIHSETHEPFVLEKAKIRGIESQGMICAAFELGIGPKSDKPEIMILKEDSVLGSNFSANLIKS